MGDMAVGIAVDTVGLVNPNRNIHEIKENRPYMFYPFHQYVSSASHLESCYVRYVLETLPSPLSLLCCILFPTNWGKTRNLKKFCSVLFLPVTVYCKFHSH